MSVSLLLLLPIITLGNIECQNNNKTITCESYDGRNTSSNTAIASCGNPSRETLVSCGLKISNDSNHISQGIEMTDNDCIIGYGALSSPTTKAPSVSPSIGVSSNPTRTPSQSPTLSKPLPIPIARCCDFTSCYSENFDCHLKVTRQRTTTNDECSTLPYLLSCTLQTQYVENNNKIYQGIFYSNSSATDYQMRRDYCTLFHIDQSNPDCATPSPSVSPTQTPSKNPSLIPTITTNAPTSKPPTKSGQTIDPSQSPSKTPSTSPTTPTKSPTNNPTQTPTKNPTQSPTKSTTSPTAAPIASSFIYHQSSEFNVCVLERYDNTQYLWLYSLCCGVNGKTFSPTRSPTPSPTIAPSQPSQPPTQNIFSDTEAEPWTSPSIPLNSAVSPPSPQPTVAFEDVGDGIVSAIHWGVSNKNRSYIHVNGNPNGAIQEIKDEDLLDYYFTIKYYKLRSGIEFTSEYGSIYVADSGQPDLICNNISESGEYNIVKIHVYVNESNGNKIEGMTMVRNDEAKTNYTCHTAMAINKSIAFQNKLYAQDSAKYKNNTIDLSECGSSTGLAGFIGYAPGLDIKTIQFQFVADAGSGNCPVQETVSTTTSKKPTFSPTPSPTNSPTEQPSKGTTAEPTYANPTDLDFSCSWVMAKGKATCEQVSTNDNKPFMTNCIGYSITGQPNSWYIKENNGIDECIVEAFKGNNSENMAAIATCCYLKTIVPTPSVCDESNKWNKRITWTNNEYWCSLGITDLFFGLILGGVIFALAIWGGFIAFCIIQRRKIDARRAKEKRLKKAPSINTDKDGDKVAKFTDEQVEDRLALERFKVDEDHHREMLQQQQLLSSRDVGLQAD